MIIPAGLQPYMKAIAWLGLLVLIGDAWLSIKFGWSIAAEMAVIAGAISVASGLLLVAAVLFHKLGWAWLGRGLAAAWAFAFIFNCWSNMGVSTANRMGEVQTAQVQQTNYAGVQSNIDEASRSLAVFEKQLATLLEQNAWAASVTAEGLREKAATLARAIAEEGSPRNGGCKRKCLNLMSEKTAVEQQIAVAEQRQTLTKQIEATRKVIADRRSQLAQTEKGISNTANQSTLFAKLISFNLADDPSQAMVVVANEGTGVGFAIVLAMLATALTLAGAWPHLQNVGALAPKPFKSPVPAAKQTWYQKYLAECRARNVEPIGIAAAA